MEEGPRTFTAVPNWNCLRIVLGLHAERRMSEKMSQGNKASEVIKTAVRERDNHECQNCQSDDTEAVIDVHHIVPRGRGGSNRMSNQVVLCRRCHDAAHSDGYAPTIQSMSTGKMEPECFELFRRFWTEILPCIGDLFGIPIEPIYDEEDNCWRVAQSDIEILFTLISARRAEMSGPTGSERPVISEYR